MDAFLNRMLKPIEVNGILYSDYFKKFGFNRTVLIIGQPDEYILNRLLIEQVKEIALIDICDFSFLNLIKSIKNICIVFYSKIKRKIDFSSLYGLKLEGLVIDFKGNWRYGNKIDISNFPNLSRLRINKTMLVDFKKFCHIESLDIYNVGICDNLLFLHYLKELKYLILTDGKLNTINGIEKLKKLISFTLENINLVECVGLRELSNIKNFSINGCFSPSLINELQLLTELRFLKLESEVIIENILWINKLLNLEVFILGCIVENGILTPCRNIPYVKLKRDEPFYNLRDKDLPKTVECENILGIPVYKKF